MSIDFLLQLIQQTLHQHSFTFISTNHDTILYQYFNNILHRQSLYFISSSHLQQTFNELLQSILRNKLSDVLFITNIQRIFLRNDLANYSSQTFQQTMIHFFINTSSQTFTIGELVIDHSLYTSTNTSSHLHCILQRILHHIFIAYFNEYFIMIK